MNTEKDVVCGMSLGEAQIIARSTYEGQSYPFCSTDCQQKFDRHPGEYAEVAEEKVESVTEGATSKR